MPPKETPERQPADGKRRGMHVPLIGAQDPELRKITSYRRHVVHFRVRVVWPVSVLVYPILGDVPCETDGAGILEMLTVDVARIMTGKVERNQSEPSNQRDRQKVIG